MFYSEKNNRQKGVSLIITFFIMTIILAMVLTISVILYSEIKVIRNIGDSVVAFYAADSGIEKVLYYDRKIMPAGAERGLCSMFSYDPVDNPNGCPAMGGESPDLDPSLYCNNPSLQPNDSEGLGCNVDVCNDCTISFDTTFSDSEKGYSVSATVVPDGDDTNFTIDSAGSYKEISRKVELYMTKQEEGEIIRIVDAYANPISSEAGTTINFWVDVEAFNGVSLIQAHIKTSVNGGDISGSPIALTLSSGDAEAGTYEGSWTGDYGVYYVDIYILDQKGYGLKQPNIQPNY
jgi:hypothetical protein